MPYGHARRKRVNNSKTMCDRQKQTVNLEFSYIEKCVDYKTIIITRCRPSKGRRCIQMSHLKNNGSMVQTCQNINVHVVNTDIIMLRPT